MGSSGCNDVNCASRSPTDSEVAWSSGRSITSSERGGSVARLAVRTRSRTRQDQIRQHAAVHENLIERREELADTLTDLLLEALEHRQAHIRRQRHRFQGDGPGASDLLRLEHPHGARRRDRLIAMPQMGELGVALAGMR